MIRVRADRPEERMLSEGALFGDFTMADPAIVIPFMNASCANHRVDAAGWPRLAALIDRVTAVTEVAAVLAREAEAMGLAGRSA